MADSTESIIFVVDGQKLEAMSLVLAASLARHHDTGGAVRIIAYVSDATAPLLTPATRALYEACGVEIAALPGNAGVWRKDYPHGNKILACAAPRSSARTTFLDTDTLCQDRLTGIPHTDPFEVFVVPEGLPTWGRDGDAWARAYGFFDLPMPVERVTLTRGRNLEYPPYFNAGFISFSDLPLEDGKSFAQLWLDCARDFDWNCLIANKRPWLDQITLPLAMAQHGLSCLVLPETYNYSISERQRMGRVRLAKLVHYHRPAYFSTLANAAELLDLTRDRVPAHRRDGLDELLQIFSPPPGESPGALLAAS